MFIQRCWKWLTARFFGVMAFVRVGDDMVAVAR
jgi:hypothetical protein